MTRPSAWRRDLDCPRETVAVCQVCEDKPAAHHVSFMDYGPRKADVCCSCAGCEGGCKPMSEQCGSEVEVEISVSGRFIRASWAGPAESPEAEVVFLNDARCNYGHELSDAEQESLRETATEDFLAEFADAAEDVA